MLEVPGDERRRHRAAPRWPGAAAAGPRHRIPGLPSSFYPVTADPWDGPLARQGTPPQGEVADRGKITSTHQTGDRAGRRAGHRLEILARCDRDMLLALHLPRRRGKDLAREATTPAQDMGPPGGGRAPVPGPHQELLRLHLSEH